ncbi:MAG: hypothetical protein Q7J48_20715 [Nocardioides sp.]|nr:hypothetical protein [Nocardioides sp.]
MTAADQRAVARDKLASIATHVEVEGHHVRGRVQRAGRMIPSLLRDLEGAADALDSIEVARPTLDDVFLTLTGRSLRGTTWAAALFALALWWGTAVFRRDDA